MLQSSHCNLTRKGCSKIKSFEHAGVINSVFFQQLWKLVVEEAGLVGQLKVMKDFFLLGRGELFLAFIDQAQGLLKLPPTGTTQHG